MQKNANRFGIFFHLCLYAVMDEKALMQNTKIFKVLSHPVRFQLLVHMANCKDKSHKHNISELGADCSLDFSVVSRHLKALKDVGLIKATRHKNDVIYEMDRIFLKNFMKDFSKIF